MSLRRITPASFVAVALCAPVAFAASGHSAARTAVRTGSSGLPAQIARVTTAKRVVRGRRVHTPVRSRAVAVLHHAKATAFAAAVSTKRASASGQPTALSAELTQVVPGNSAEILSSGYAAAPANAPAAVQQAIWAGNQLIGLPYVYGGGHGGFIDSGYDCSGSVSFSLHGGGMLAAPLDSGEFEGWGSSGPGRWITVFANGGHAFMEIAGIRLDTSSAGDPTGEDGPRWRPLLADTSSFVERHPTGY